MEGVLISKMARYKHCCVCFDVHTGAVILAMIGLLVAGIGIVSDSIGLGIFTPELEKWIDRLKISSMEEFEEKGEPMDERSFYETSWKQMDLVKDLVPWVFVIQIITSVFNFLINGCLLYGLHKKQGMFMLPWMIANMAELVVSRYIQFSAPAELNSRF